MTNIYEASWMQRPVRASMLHYTPIYYRLPFPLHTRFYAKSSHACTLDGVAFNWVSWQVS
jgi:hypothetical protein